MEGREPVPLPLSAPILRMDGHPGQGPAFRVMHDAFDRAAARERHREIDRRPRLFARPRNPVIPELEGVARAIDPQPREPFRQQDREVPGGVRTAPGFGEGITLNLGNPLHDIQRMHP